MGRLGRKIKAAFGRFGKGVKRVAGKVKNFFAGKTGQALIEVAKKGDETLKEYSP